MTVPVQDDAQQAKLIKRVRRNTLGDVLLRARARYPEKTAFVYHGLALTYAAFDDRVNQTAHGLRAAGVKKGDRFAVVSKNSLDFVVINFALARIGAVMVPLNYMLTAADVRYILQHAGVTGVFASPEYVPLLEQAAPDLPITWRFLMDAPDSDFSQWIPLILVQDNQPADLADEELDDDDLAHVLYTSGTESRPKGVMLSHKSLISEYVSCIVDGQMSPDDIFVHALPLYHSAQLHVFLGPSVYVGATGIILDSATPERILQTIEEERATQLFCPPTVWIALLRHPDFDKRDLSTLKKCYYGAAIMPREILKELARRLPNARFWNFYGQTEVAPLATALQPEDQLRKLGSAGVPTLNVQTKIVDENDQEVPRGEIGEIVHRTPHAMLGYLNDPENTEKAFRNGWFHSGDLGYMDEEGFITIVDRKKDMIKTGGINVSSREVEEVLYQLEGVSEVAVIGVSDPYWIEAVTAVIVPKAGAALTEQDVLDFCRGRLAKYKIPKNVYFTDELPKNPSGKVLKRTLREIYQS